LHLVGLISPLINSSLNSHQLFFINIDLYPNTTLYVNLFTFYVFRPFRSTIIR